MKKLLLFAMIAMLLAPSFAYAGFGLGLKGGLASTNDIDDNLTHVGADLRFGMVMVDFIISAEYSWKSYQVDILGTPFDYKFHSLAGTGSLVIPIKLGIATPYAGGGAGSHTMIFDYADESNTETKFGYHFIGGIKIGAPAMPIKLYGEYRHYWVKFDEETMKYYTLAAGVIFGI